MSSIRKYGTSWEHTNGAGDYTIVEKDDAGYFVPGFYGDGEPRFGTLKDVREFIDQVQRPYSLPENWRDWWFFA